MGSQDAFLLGDQWRCVLQLLPADLEQSVKVTGALVRKREVRDAQTLLRLVLAYSYLDLSLRDACVWAEQAGVAHLTDVALLKRLRRADEWMAHLLGQELASRGVGGPASPESPASPAQGRRLRVVDASTIVPPGAERGHDWRVHLSLSVCPLRVDEVHVTDWTGAERLTNFEIAPGDIVLGDRGYAQRAAIASAVASGADVVVRLPWNNPPLLSRESGKEGEPFDILEHVCASLGSAGPGAVCEFAVQIAPDPEHAKRPEHAKQGVPAVQGRVIAVRKSQEAAERARREARTKARTHGRTVDERTLSACDYLFVFTTLPPEEYSAAQVLALYRLRWQVELCFKRLKGLVGLGNLRAKDPRLCRTYLLGNLLSALLIEELAHRWLGFSPWDVGDGRGNSRDVPAAHKGRNNRSVQRPQLLEAV